MVLVKKDHGDVIRSHIKARHKVEQQTDKHEQLLLNIVQVTLSSSSSIYPNYLYHHHDHN